jgi:hypothetical protein
MHICCTANGPLRSNMRRHYTVAIINKILSVSQYIWSRWIVWSGHSIMHGAPSWKQTIRKVRILYSIQQTILVVDRWEGTILAIIRAIRKVRRNARPANDPCCHLLRRHDPCSLNSFEQLARFAEVLERTILVVISLQFEIIRAIRKVRRRGTILVVICWEGTILAVWIHSSNSQGSQKC